LATKVCSRCGIEKKLSIEYFPERKANKDGFNGKCRKCVADYAKEFRKYNKDKTSNYEKNRKNKKERNIKCREWHHFNMEKVKAYRAIYYRDNKEKLIEQMRPKQLLYRLENKYKISERQKIWAKKNKTIIREKSKEYRRNNQDVFKKYYYENRNNLLKQKSLYWFANKDMLSKKHKIYYEKNKAILSEKNRIWILNNPDKVKANSQRRRTKKLLLPATLTIIQWEDIKLYFNNSCCYCGKKLPLAQDHFIPLKNGGGYTINNIVPSCRSCNSSKGAKDFFIWYPTHRSYNKKREQKIMKHLGYEEEGQQLKII